MVQVRTIEPLSAENVLWANTVLTAGFTIGFVVYTGPETRAVMNTSHPEEEGGRLTGVERVHEAASQVRVRVAIPCPLIDFADLCV